MWRVFPFLICTEDCLMPLIWPQVNVSQQCFLVYYWTIFTPTCVICYIYCYIQRVEHLIIKNWLCHIEMIICRQLSVGTVQYIQSRNNTTCTLQELAPHPPHLCLVKSLVKSLLHHFNRIILYLKLFLIGHKELKCLWPLIIYPQSLKLGAGGSMTQITFCKLYIISPYVQTIW